MSIKNFDAFSYIGKYQYLVIKNLGGLIKKLKSENYNLLIIDSNISRKFPDLEKSLDLKKLKIEVNNETKSVDKLIYFLSLFSEFGLTRNSKILVVGGATMQDMFATVCCLYHRGINWYFVPTTLLAQGDSCIGSKTSLDGFGKKNQFGVFYPPLKIFVCRDFLFTLPKVEIYSGIGDIIHYLLPYDENNNCLKTILDLSRKNNINQLIDFSVFLSSKAMKIKSELIKIDEFDKGPRKIFNFGHTFGHVIEKSSVKEVPHGIAVLCGLYIALNFKKKSINISNVIELQKNILKELIEFIIRDQDIVMSIKSSNLQENLISDKKNLFPNKIRVILPTSKDETLWSSKNQVSKYGLNFFDYEIDICLKAFEYLKDIKGITFC